jgi:1-deoxy-D-xylulose-5-phosphate reductoisomerase
MGKKITVDCATMVNKGLEVIEAHYLFDMEYDKIETILHKESIVHSMVEYNDNSIIAQMGKHDMRIPIQYALTYPKKETYKLDTSLSFKEISNLTFKEMDYERYPMLKLAYEVGKMGGIMPTVYNASNEEAVKLFINKKIKFLEIENIITEMVEKFNNVPSPTLEDILNTDKSVREYIIRKYN